MEETPSWRGHSFTLPDLEDALLFRTLATLRIDVPVFDTVEDLHWRGLLAPGL